MLVYLHRSSKNSWEQFYSVTQFHLLLCCCCCCSNSSSRSSCSSFFHRTHIKLMKKCIQKKILNQCNCPGGHFYNTLKWSPNPATRHELLPKFIAAKWNIFLSFGLKVPFSFPCLAHICLSNSCGFVCFSMAYVTLVVALLFGSLKILPAFLQGFIDSICFRPSRWKGLHASTSGWTVFLILRLTRDCIFFPRKAHAANSRSASSSLVRMDWF